MAGPNEGDEPPPATPLSRRPRAPTITIDTTAVSPSGLTPNMPQDGQADRPHSLDHSTSPYEEEAVSPATIVEPSGLGQTNSRPQLRADTNLDSRDSRPTSPHNVSSPVQARGNDTAGGFLAVPNTLRSRQNSVDSDDASRSISSSQGETTVVASNSTQAERWKTSTRPNEKIMLDETALKPDAGTEGDFTVDDNPFAFTPGELGKMFNPKNLGAFYQLGGLHGLEKGLRADRKSGLSLEETSLDGQVSFVDAVGSDKLRNDGAQAPRTGSGKSTAGGAFSDRLRVYKDNRLPVKKGKSLLQLMWITYNDKILILLSVAAAVSLAVGLYETFGGHHDPDEPKIEWVEGVAIIVAIAIVVIVGSLNDYSKERQFAKLNMKKQDRDVKVIRSGKTMEISVHDLLVGDVVHLEPGDLVPVDGVLIQGFNVKCDESQATGESDIIRKRNADDVYDAIVNHDDLKKMDPFIQSGSRIMEGIGTFMCTSTGVHSSYGRTLMSLNDDPEMTPLQSKLNVIATYIAKIGGSAALLLFIVLFIKFLAQLPNMEGTSAAKGQRFLNIFIVVVTIIVVAIPEGLPLAVTLALAFATTRMLKDNNLVRHLKACEVMGNATTICSDKTGTLTQNRMQVVAGTVGTSHRFGGAVQGDDEATDAGDGISAVEFTSMLSGPVKDILLNSIALNSTAFEGEVDGEKTYIGSKTETALLLFARDHLGLGPVSEIRENATTLQVIPFDSSRKCMGIVVQLPNGRARLYIKGASEIVLDKCMQILHDPSKDDSLATLTDDNKSTITRLIDTYASRSLRTIGISYREFESWPPKGLRRGDGKDQIAFEDLFRDMVFLGMVGIQDPLRDGVFDAVKLCQSAGVTVRMVTGDNKLTAQAIAKECGILQPDSIIMEGPVFRNLNRFEQNEIIPRLHVLARSSPEDKRVLVKRLKEMGDIVAVTGDGTNDAPALKTADVGFSMGIAGTEVAKEASAIILMDDNFTSIVKALKWGRAVNDAVKRFLQFQLTVNITAVFLTFITAVSNNEETSVLSAVQLLWVNLIMDTLAALALATDPPQDSVLDRKPEPKGASIITPTMWKMILGQAVYQLVITLLLYYGRGNILPLDDGLSREDVDEAVATLVFNTFVWMQIFKMWNARRLDNKLNIFEGLSKNWFFIGINFAMMGAQILIVFKGGAAFSVSGGSQTGALWAIAILLGFLSIPIGVVIRLIPDSACIALVPAFLKRRARKVPGLIVSDEDAAMYPEPLVDVRGELNFIKRMKGGRLNNLRFAIAHPKEAYEMHRSPSHSRENSLQVPRTPPQDDSFAELAQTHTPESRARSRSNRSRSNSALGAPTVMAGLVAAGIAAGWSPGNREQDAGDAAWMRPRGSPERQPSDAHSSESPKKEG